MESLCELCKRRHADTLVESEVGMWPTKVPVCNDCSDRAEEAEIGVDVEELRYS